MDFIKHKNNILFLFLSVFSVLRGCFFVFFVGIILVDCSKTPTTSGKQEQVIVTGSITQNTTWQSRRKYVVEGVVTVEQGVSQQEDAWGIELNQSEGCGVFEFCRFEGLTYGVNVYEASVSVSECEFQ